MSLHRPWTPALLLGGAALFTSSALIALDPWSEPVILDSRAALEITPFPGPVTGNTVFVGTLFDLATNSLELGRVNVGVNPPTASFVPITTGSTFALGGIDQAAGFVGFSFIDPSFNLRFARCAPPCNSVSTVTINGTDDWIDSSSAASGNDFFVAGLDDTTNSLQVQYSDDGGATWHLLNTLTPPDLYPNFNGGKRISLTVDPAATNPATTRNCLLYETRPSPGTSTNLHLNCRNGATPVFDVVVDNDIPNALNQFDRLIETSSSLGQDAVLNFLFGARYSRRQTQQVRSVIVNNAGGIVGTPTNVGPVPPGDFFYGLAGVLLAPEAVDRVLFPSTSGTRAQDIQVDPGSGQVFDRAGPKVEQSALSIMQWASTQDPADAFLFAFAMVLNSGARSLAPDGPESPDTPDVTGFGVTRRAIGLFDDSFETHSLVRWSTSVP